MSILKTLSLALFITLATIPYSFGAGCGCGESVPPEKAKHEPEFIIWTDNGDAAKDYYNKGSNVGCDNQENEAEAKKVDKGFAMGDRKNMERIELKNAYPDIK